jgi:hypothetical protein
LLFLTVAAAVMDLMRLNIPIGLKELENLPTPMYVISKGSSAYS